MLAVSKNTLISCLPVQFSNIRKSAAFGRVFLNACWAQMPRISQCTSGPICSGAFGQNEIVFLFENKRSEEISRISHCLTAHKRLNFSSTFLNLTQLLMQNLHSLPQVYLVGCLHIFHWVCYFVLSILKDFQLYLQISVVHRRHARDIRHFPHLYDVYNHTNHILSENPLTIDMSWLAFQLPRVIIQGVFFTGTKKLI